LSKLVSARCDGNHTVTDFPALVSQLDLETLLVGMKDVEGVTI